MIISKYDYDIGRFTSTDVLFEKYYGWTPYQYSANNPINMLDWNGKDAEQREQALEKAEEYMNSGSIYNMGAKGEPGTPVDCSGMVSKCMIAGGEEDIDLQKGQSKGIIPPTVK